jgi:hypothetical protein
MSVHPTLKRLALVTASLLFAGACEQHSDQPTAPVQAARSALTPDSGDYIATPAGWYPSLLRA